MGTRRLPEASNLLLWQGPYLVPPGCPRVPGWDRGVSGPWGRMPIPMATCQSYLAGGGGLLFCQGSNGLPGLPFLARLGVRQCWACVLAFVRWGHVRRPATVFLQFCIPDQPSSLPLTAAFFPPSRALLWLSLALLPRFTVVLR